MIDYITSNLWLLWSILVFVCLILELSSGDFYITCFAIGGLFAIVNALLGIPFWAQVIVWVVCSLLSVRLIRPHLVKWLHRGGEHRVSNADALIGRVGTVIETIEPDGSGYLKVDGDNWKAVTDESQTIRRGEKARIVSRESIIVKVVRVEE